MANKEFKSFFKTVGGNEGGKCHYPTRLDTYGCGCQHDCSYCYAKSLLDFRNMWDNAEPSVADIKKIERKIKKIDKSVVPVVRLGGMTDCFQPLERQKRVTYETIKLLNKYGISYLIVTKSAMVAEQEYIDIMDKNLAHIQISITCTSDDLYRRLKFEKASLPSDRMRAVEKLQENGFDISIRLSPFIPEFVDTDVINSIKCDKILVEFLRVNSFIRRWFDIDYSEYTVKHGGYYHLPLAVKKKLISEITIPEITVCEDEDEAYEYWQNSFNPNKDDCCNLRKIVNQT